MNGSENEHILCKGLKEESLSIGVGITLGDSWRYSVIVVMGSITKNPERKA